LQGVVNCLTSISNQMLRMSGKSGKNGGWPYFDGTFTGYPAFKRKWQSYYRNHHQLTPQRELVQLFRENCLHEKTADRLKRAESMAAAWLVLDTLFDDPLQFTKDLMGDILAYAKMKDYEYEKLFDYYSMVQYTIDEADKANRGNMFLIAYNIDEMTRPLPPREEEIWRRARRRVQPEDLGPAFVAFLQERFEWSTDQMCGLRKSTTKPLSTTSESRGRSDAKHGGSGETKFKKPSGGGPFRQAHAMVVQEGSSGATRFPPPAVWDHTAVWAHPCIMGKECSGAHSPASCLKFKRLTPKARLMLVQSKELCQLCFRHLDSNKCWSLGKVPNCEVPECGAAHHSLLHDAIAKPRAMIVKRMDNESPNVLLCRQEAGMKRGREVIKVNVLYDWGATVSMVTHQAAAKASLVPMPRKEKEVSGLNGTKSISGCTYEVPMMDHLGQVKLIHAAGVDKIAWMEEAVLPPKLDMMFPELAGRTTILRQKEGEMDILMGLDNSRWLPRQASREDESPGSFRLMKSQFGKRYMIMGSDEEVREPEPIESPIRNALEGLRKAGTAFAVWLMIGFWAALYYTILSPMRFVQARHDAQRDLGYGIKESGLPIDPFADWPPALRRARIRLEERYRTFLIVNEREEKERAVRTRASSYQPLDDEEERNMQFWDLWTPEEKEAQRERERLRDSWCPKRVATISQERWGVKRRRSSDPY
jgi:hypothetical protein